jgi:hypothetical protein
MAPPIHIGNPVWSPSTHLTITSPTMSVGMSSRAWTTSWFSLKNEKQCSGNRRDLKNRTKFCQSFKWFTFKFFYF